MANSVRLAKGDDAHVARLAAGLSEIELALRLEVRPAVHRAAASLDRISQAVPLCKGLRLLGVLSCVIAKASAAGAEVVAKATAPAIRVAAVMLLTISLNILSPSSLDDNARIS